ncbi:hypothetical protein ACIGHG_23325 [Bacillus sp. NPDC077411]|uniref:hypothetical protein n=1 Tax=Bacillus sp. NPDC077411 TaxID=3363947 RepID=UPI0037C80603
MSHWLFDVGEWCDICGEEIKGTAMHKMYIEGSEKTLCESCKGTTEKKMKIVNPLILQDMMKALLEQFGRSELRRFNLNEAEKLVKAKGISLDIEKRGGAFNQEKMGEFISLSTDELLFIIKFLKKKISSSLWVNAMISAIFEKEISITLASAGDGHDRTAHTNVG